MFKFKRKKEKPLLSPVQVLRRKVIRLRIAFLSTLVVLGIGLFVLIFSNFNYLLFKTLIARNYIHTYTLDEMFLYHLGFVPSNHARYFDNLVIAIVTQLIRVKGGDIYTYLYTPAQRIAMEERIRTRAAGAEFYEIVPGTVVLRLPNTAPLVQNFVFDNRDEIGVFDNLILDLRGNNGGELAVVQNIASLFLQTGDTIAFDETRWNLFSRERRARRRHSGFFDFDHIIILQDASTASSAEVLIAALAAHLDNETTIGEQTFGKAVGQVTLPLRQGFAVRATVLNIQNPQGESIHNIGIAPHIEYKGDDMLSFALDKLQGGNINER